MTTPLLGLTEIAEASPLAHVVVNTNFRLLEAHSKRILQSIALATPPGSPAQSAVYFVATSPTGAWAGKAGQLAVFVLGDWYFLGAPSTRERWWNAGTAAWIEWNGSAWV